MVSSLARCMVTKQPTGSISCLLVHPRLVLPGTHTTHLAMMGQDNHAVQASHAAARVQLSWSGFNE